MIIMGLHFPFNATDYFKFLVNFRYAKCNENIQTLSLNFTYHDFNDTTKVESVQQHETTWKESVDLFLSSISETINRISIFSSSKPTETIVPVSLNAPEVIEPCDSSVEFEYEWRMYPVYFTFHVIVLLMTLILCLVVSRVIKRCIVGGAKQRKTISSDENKLMDDGEDDEEIMAFRPKHCLNHSNLEDRSHIENVNVGSSRPISMKNERILLSYMKFTKFPNDINLKPRTVPVQSFLKHTTDYLFSMMDKLLLEIHRSPSRLSPTRSVSDIGISPTYGSLTSTPTPRRPLRRSMNRSRGSSPNLPVDDDQSSDPLEKRAWEEYIQNIAMNNHVNFDFDVDLNMSISGESTTKKLLQFYLNQGSIKIEQLQVTNLIVNYSLYLLTKEFESIGIVGGLQFKEFKMIGSMQKGLKVSNAGQVDFIMDFIPVDFHVIEALDQMKSDEIPPGKLILRAKPNMIGNEPKCLKTVQISQKKYICVCAKSVSYIAEEIIDLALQNLYTGMRSLIDRLPFRMQRAATGNIVLTIDTRSVIGLGLQEIKVQLIPSFYLPIGGWFQAVPLYATSYSSTQQEYKTKPSRGEEPVPIPLGCSDVIWNLETHSFEELFLKEIDRKMVSCGVHSCHRICIRILKTLFTTLSRKSLLDRGELRSSMIETVVYYLLLESSPDQWTFSQISDRISDAYLYLKSALESGRLPYFFINNPHLVKQMPLLHSLPFLLRGKQYNLLADARLETVDKKLNFMQHRIRDTGLEECFRDVYSPDTWEWEFFVYS